MSKSLPPSSSPQDGLANGRNTLPKDLEIFRTSPESSSIYASFNNCDDEIGDELDRDGETVAVDADSVDSRRAVDLGRGTGLGFSEVEVDSTRRILANSNPDGTFRRESEEIRISNRGFPSRRKLSNESPFESPSVLLGTAKEKNTGELLNSLKNVSPSPGACSESELENQQNREVTFEVGEGRKTQSETDNVEGNSGRNKSNVEDIDQVRYTSGNGSNSLEMQEKTERNMALPSWANVRVGDDERADEELEVNETELPSWANERVVGDERAEELDVNERETVHSGTDSTRRRDLKRKHN